MAPISSLRQWLKTGADEDSCFTQQSSNSSKHKLKTSQSNKRKASDTTTELTMGVNLSTVSSKHFNGAVTNKRLKCEYRQTFMDLGQKLDASTRCSECGMEYCPGEPSDELEHKSFHKRYTSDITITNLNALDTICTCPNGDRIIRLWTASNTSRISKVRSLLGWMTREMGCIQETLLVDPTTKVFVYLVDKTIVGCIVASHVKTAHPLLASTSSTAADGTDGLSDSIQNDDVCLCDTTAEQSTELGIRLIWTHQQHRKKSIATMLLDAVRSNFHYGWTVPKDKCAFSQPTFEGRMFAERYFETRSFLVFLSE